MSLKGDIANRLPQSLNLLNRETFVFLALLLLSAAAWFVVTLREVSKIELHIPVKLVDIPEKKVMLDSECDTITITVSDEGYVLWKDYSKQEDIEPIKISFTKYDKHDGEVIIAANELMRMVQQNLKSTTTIGTFKREKLTFRYCDGTRKRLPVRVRESDDAGSSFDIKVKPDSIDVYAHPSKLSQMTAVYAESIKCPDGISETFTCKAPVEKEDGVKYTVQEVSVTAKALTFIEKQLEIPIICINEPQGVKLRLFPSRITVVFQVDMRMYKTVEASHLSAVVDYNDVHNSNTDNVEVKIVQKPHFIRNLKQERKSVGFLVENS